MQESSLRERRKAQTWRELHAAAADAVLRDGLSAVTVEQIAAAAGVSPRTFFNYFATKDHAVMGLRDPQVPDELRQRTPDGGSFLRRVVELFHQVLASALPVTSTDLRIRLMGAHPELARLLKDTMHRCEDAVREVLHGWAAQGLEPHSLAPGEDLDDRISMAVLAAGAVLRHVLTHPDRTPGSDPTPEDLDRAVALLTRLIRTDTA